MGALFHLRDFWPDFHLDSILWRKIDRKWWLGYLHASEEPQEVTKPVWKDE